MVSLFLREESGGTCSRTDPGCKLDIQITVAVVPDASRICYVRPTPPFLPI